METDGLLEEGGEIHTIVVQDLEIPKGPSTGDNSDSSSSDLVFASSYINNEVNGSIEDGVALLEGYDLLIGHNIIGFDLPFLLKMGFPIVTKPRDTYIMSKMFYPDQKMHGLEYYGKKFGRHKPEQEDWSVLTEEMIHRCREDVAINVIVYEYFIKRELSTWNWMPAILLEQLFQYEQVLQEYEGVDIDIDLALSLIKELDDKVNTIDSELMPLLPQRIKSAGPVNKPFLKSGKFSKMCEDWYDYDINAG